VCLSLLVSVRGGSLPLGSRQEERGGLGALRVARPQGHGPQVPPPPPELVYSGHNVLSVVRYFGVHGIRTVY
jgi:hypothetical protein